jgi:hypothetical protein
MSRRKLGFESVHEHAELEVEKSRYYSKRLDDAGVFRALAMPQGPVIEDEYVAIWELGRAVLLYYDGGVGCRIKSPVSREMMMTAETERMARGSCRRRVGRRC